MKTRAADLSWIMLAAVKEMYQTKRRSIIWYLLRLLRTKKFRKMVGEHQNDWTDLNLTQHLSHASLQPAVFNCSLKKYHYDHCHYALCKNKYQLSLLKWPRFCVEDHCWWWELRWEQFSAIFTLRVHRKSFLTFTGLYGVTWTLSTFQNKNESNSFFSLCFGILKEIQHVFQKYKC